MANYSVENWVSSVGPLSVVAGEIETQLETIESGKTIRHISVVAVGNNTQGIIIYDT